VSAFARLVDGHPRLQTLSRNLSLFLLSRRSTPGSDLRSVTLEFQRNETVPSAEQIHVFAPVQP